MDTLTPAERSRVMRAVKDRDTTPERVTRSVLHRLGYRFRLHRAELPGKPDIVLARHRQVIEVRGCFWHGHDCGRCRIPATRREYWIGKIERNRRRDQRTVRQLRRLGWSVLVIWECQTADEEALASRLARRMPPLRPGRAVSTRRPRPRRSSTRAAGSVRRANSPAKGNRRSAGR